MRVPYECAAFCAHMGINNDNDDYCMSSICWTNQSSLGGKDNAVFVPLDFE